MANPYAVEGIVTDPVMLVGRAVHLRRLLRHAKEMNCVAVVGPPGIGKSSLLYQLSHQEQLEATHVSLYLDLSDPAFHSPQVFRREVIQGFGHRLGRKLVGSSEERLDQAITLILKEEERYVLLCLDGFHDFAAAPEVDDAFLEELRQLGFARRLAIVVGSPYPLADLAHQGVIQRSFTRLFDEQMDLGLLPGGDADRLIREPALREGVEFSPPALELARELGGRHPLYLQMAAHVLFEHAVAEGEMDLQAVRDDFAESAFPYLHRLWTSLEADDREAIRYYTGVSGVRPPSVGQQQELMRRGIVERRGGEVRLFSEHFREVVRRRRRDLDAPLPVPEEVSPEEEHEGAPAEDTVEVAEAPGEESVSPAEATTVATVTSTEEAPPPAGVAPGPSTVSPLVTDIEPQPSEGPSPQEVSSLAALGCYVSAITLDLVFIGGILVARTFFRLPTREMVILIGLSAVLPVVFLFLGRAGGGLWARLFGWLVRRL